MCGGGGGGDGGAAKREQERQQKIDLGYREIKKIFEGYTAGTNKVAAPTVGQSYYGADGKPLQVKRIKVANPAAATQARMDVIDPITDRRRLTTRPPAYIDQDAVFSGNKNVGNVGSLDLFSALTSVPGFDENFYNSREKAYTDFAKPQLEDQYGDAQNELIYALARTGRLQSSTRGEKFGDLQKKYDIQKTNIADKAREYSGTVRGNIEKSRSDLTALNASLADPSAIADQARLAAQSLQTQQAFDPLAPLFQNVTEGIATQADLERRNAARYNTGMFTPGLNSSAGRVIGR